MFPFNSARHRIMHGLPMNHWADREFPGEGLFVYFHQQARNFCWARWGRPGWLEQVLTIGPNLQDFDRDKAHELAKRVRSQPGEDLKTQLRRANLALDQQMVDQQEEEREAVSRVAREFGKPMYRDHPAFNPDRLHEVWGG